jgi:hypothetical protein
MRANSVVWIPVLLVGAMVYWTLAFGFGGLSLMTLTQFENGDDASDWLVKDSYQSITVNLSDSPDPVETQTPEAAQVKVDLVPDRGSEAGDPIGQGQGQGARGGVTRQGPGNTAF